MLATLLTRRQTECIMLVEIQTPLKLSTICVAIRYRNWC
uniref:Uncharacterized protein n=1 Tax=Anguilla anguilla TaxID=7936 RepID=A0A0E9VX61_ANGAN